MMYGSTSPREFDEMDPAETEALVRIVGRARQDEVEMRVTLAKFVAGARLRAAGGEEIR